MMTFERYLEQKSYLDPKLCLGKNKKNKKQDSSPNLTNIAANVPTSGTGPSSSGLASEPLAVPGTQ